MELNFTSEDLSRTKTRNTEIAVIIFFFNKKLYFKKITLIFINNQRLKVINTKDNTIL